MFLKLQLLGEQITKDNIISTFFHFYHEVYILIHTQDYIDAVRVEHIMVLMATNLL